MMGWTYILQSNRPVFNQYAVNLTCSLCSDAPETRKHFIAECNTGRDIYTTKTLNTSALQGVQKAKIEYLEFLTQLIMDVSVFPNLIPEQIFW